MAAGSAEALDRTTVMVAGAGSQIGVFALRQLAAQGRNVFAVSRSGPRPGLSRLENVCWLDETEAMRSIANCRYLLSAGPLEVAWRLLSVGPGPQRAVIFSSTSVESKANSPSGRERAQAASMLNRENELRSIAGRHGTRLTILRPTLVYGCGLDANISRLANWIRRFGFVPVSAQARGMRMPVHAEDLASVAIRALFSDRDLPELMNVAGGEQLAYSEMVRRIFPALERPERVIGLPVWLFAGVAAAVALFRPNGGINAEMVRRQATDLVFDDTQARALLGHDPRPFRPGKDDFSLGKF